MAELAPVYPSDPPLPERPRAGDSPKSRRTRGRIVREAMRLFAEQGYAASPNPVIAAAAGLTRGAMLYHFPDRETLVRAAVAFIQERRATLFEEAAMTPKVQTCLWFDRNAEEAAHFYAQTFPDTRIDDVWHAPGDYPSGHKGDVLLVEMTLLGVPVLLLNGGPAFKLDEAVSFQVATDDQAETDRYWNAIVGNGGQESECGWCKDKWGVSWQITPRTLTEAMAAGGDEAKRAFAAMMTMQKIDIATIEAAMAEVPADA